MSKKDDDFVKESEMDEELGEDDTKPQIDNDDDEYVEDEDGVVLGKIDDPMEEEEEEEEEDDEEDEEYERTLNIRKDRRDLLKKLKDEQEAELEKLTDEEAKKMNKFNYLLKQTEIFSINYGRKPAPPPKKTQTGGAQRKAKMLTEKEEDKELLEESLEEQQIVRFTTSPNYVENTKLRNYQILGLNWMIKMYENGMNGILAEMGLGKTLQSISFLGYLKHYRKNKKPNIVIVPKSVITNWMNEVKKWCPSLKVLKFHGNKDERKELKEKKLIKGTFDILITSYEIAILEKAALRKFKFKYLVIDEAHRIKNEKSVLSKCVRLFNTEYRLLLTGTPLQNNLHELWALLNFLLPEVFSDAEEFDSWFNLKEGQAENAIMEHLHKILKPFMLRRLKSDVETDIPPKKEIYVECGMSTMQKDWYKSILTKDSKNILAIKGREKLRLLNIVMQLRKVCNHPYLFDGAEIGPPFTCDTHIINNSGKMVILDRLLSRLKEQDSRVLIFSQMTRMLDILEDYFYLKGYKYCRIDGQTSSEDRERQLEEYNAKGSEKFIFLLSTRAGGLGINLATADTVILYDSDWNPQADLQAQDRCHRIGQKKPVNVYRLITKGGIEEKIYQRAVKKLYLDAVVIQQGRLVEQNTSLSKSELLAMITFGAEEIFKTQQTDDEDNNFGITDEELENILQRGEKKFEEMDKNMKETCQSNLLNFSLLEDSNLYEFEGLDYSQKPTQSILVEDLKDDINEDYLKTVCVDYVFEDAIFSKNCSILYFKNKNIASKALENLKTHGLKVKFCKKNDFLLQQIELEIDQNSLLNQDLNLRRRSKYLTDNQDGSQKRYLPKEPKYYDFQFVNEKRLIELWKKSTSEDEEFTEDDEKEKENLLNEGFLNWNKKDFTNFIKGLEKYGRDSINEIEIEGKSKKEIQDYSIVFLKRINELNDYDKIWKKILRGESLIERMNLNNKLLLWKTQKYKNPWFEMTFNYGQIKGKQFTLEEDSFIICMSAQFGYGNFESIKLEIRKCWEFRFDWFFKSRTTLELQKRCDTLLKLIEKEHYDEVGGFQDSLKRKVDSIQPSSYSTKKKKKQDLE